MIAVLSRIDGSVRRTGTTVLLAGVTVRVYTATETLAAQVSTDSLGHHQWRDRFLANLSRT